MRIVFMGSPQFAVPALEAIHASQHEIVAVVTQPDRPSGRKLQTHPPPVKVAAHRFNLPVLQPATTKSADFFEQLRTLQPELLVVVAYGEILRANLLGLPPHGAVNLHASLLPKFRGAAPIAWAILQGERITGATTMLMNEGMDAGPILLQDEIQIADSDTTETLGRKISERGALLLTRTLDSLQKKELVPITQDTSQVSYAPKLKKEDGRVDWNHAALQLSRQVRAFNPWPGTFSTIRGFSVKLWTAEKSNQTTILSPGEIIEITGRSFIVACGEQSALEIFELQPESRPRMPVADFIRGYQVKTGDRFS